MKKSVFDKILVLTRLERILESSKQAQKSIFAYREAPKTFSELKGNSENFFVQIFMKQIESVKKCPAIPNLIKQSFSPRLDIKFAVEDQQRRLRIQSGGNR